MRRDLQFESTDTIDTITGLPTGESSSTGVDHTMNLSCCIARNYYELIRLVWVQSGSQTRSVSTFI